MADNKPVLDGAGASFQGAADELSDGSFSPKVSLLAGDQTTAPISPATSGNQTALNTRVGDLTEAAPASDTASSGLNGRLQRIAQRITALIALLPASLGQKGKTASLAVTLASDEDLLARLGEVQASPTANTLLDRVKALLNGIVLAAGSNLIGKVNVVPTASSNGATASKVASAATTNAVNLKATAGQLYGIHVFNKSAAVKFLKLYNLAAAPTVGTDVPIWTVPLPAGGGFSERLPNGISFSTGIAYAITGAAADADTTAVGAGDVLGLIHWI